MLKRDHSWMNANRNTLLGALCVSHKLNRKAHIARGLHVGSRNAADTLTENLIHSHARIERDGSKNSNFCCSVKAINISGGISLSKAFLLSLAQSLIVRQAILAHAGKHVIGRTVNNTHDGRDLISN